jgi:hypothetical protein
MKRRTNYEKHGMSDTRLYSIWTKMNRRCYEEKNNRYNIYGGRGITVCYEWHLFIPFMEWALSNGYKDNLTIDRINVNGNYEPKNCKFSTQGEQQRNRRKSDMSNITIRNGKFRVKINRFNKQIQLGTFDTIEKAVEIRNEYLKTNYNERFTCTKTE